MVLQSTIIQLFLLPFLVVASTTFTASYRPSSITFPARQINARSLPSTAYLSRRQTTSSSCSSEDEVCVGTGEDDSCWCVPKETVESLCETGLNYCAVGAGACCPTGTTCGSNDGQAACVAVVTTTTTPTTTTSEPTSTTSSTTSTSSTSTQEPTETAKEAAATKDEEEKPKAKPKEKSAMNPGVIIGIIFSILGAIGLAFVIYILYAQKRKTVREAREAYAHPVPKREGSKASSVATVGLGIFQLGKGKNKTKVADLEIGHPQMVMVPDRNFSFQNGHSSSEAALVSGGLPQTQSQGRCITPPNGPISDLNTNKALPVPNETNLRTPPIGGAESGQRGQSSPSLYSPTTSIRRPSDNMIDTKRTYTAFSPQFAPKNLDNPLPHISTQYRPFSPGYSLQPTTSQHPTTQYPAEVAPLKIDKPFTPPPRSAISPAVTLAERRLRGSRNSRGSTEYQIPAPIITGSTTTVQRTLSTPTLHGTPTLHVGTMQEVKQVSVSRKISDVQKERGNGGSSGDDSSSDEDVKGRGVVSPLSPRSRAELPDILKVRTPMKTGGMQPNTPYWQS